MDELPDSLLLHILSRLDDFTDVARCRVAWKAFDTVFPGLQSINLRCSLKWHNSSNPSVSFKKNFLDIISKLEAVESLCIGLEGALISNLHNNNSHDPCLTDVNFAKEWLPMVSKSLKSLSISDYYYQHPSNVLPLISAHCYKLVNLKLDVVDLSVDNMNPMPMLTSVLTVKKFENLKTLWLDIKYIGDLLSKFPITRTVETLTLESRSWISTDATYSKLTLGKVFTVFPNVLGQN
ncbi:hypothetical protein M8C21_020948 [Ambrosia artemisiifolia]|uniref:F-box domain-containing protein n=1 Tax=Ambrosia artemisiifolia TaxID=4212 RepID=A0AAD5GMA2_AMBAR|nr:hypothetical protein M8C21_020948 [Ambrosia artemisiifolia]